jgi:hypothetical protein
MMMMMMMMMTTTRYKLSLSFEKVCQNEMCFHIMTEPCAHGDLIYI